MRACSFALASAAAALLSLPASGAQQTETLYLRVENTQGKPFQGMTLSTKGPGGASAPSDSGGSTTIQFSGDRAARQPYKLSLQVKIPATHRIFAPPEGRVPIPWHLTGSEGYETVIVGQPGDRLALLSPAVLRSSVRSYAALSAPHVLEDLPRPFDRERAVGQIAADLGFTAAVLDKAVRSWGVRAETPDDKALAAFYNGNYGEAAQQAELARHRAAAACDASGQHECPETARDRSERAFLLAQSRYRQGRLSESVLAWKDAIAYMPNNSEYLNGLGLTLQKTGAAAPAEAAFVVASRNAFKVPAWSPPESAWISYNAAELLYRRGDYAAAQPLYRFAMKKMGEDPQTYPFTAQTSQDRIDALEQFTRAARWVSPVGLLQRWIGVLPRWIWRLLALAGLMLLARYTYTYVQDEWRPVRRGAAIAGASLLAVGLVLGGSLWTIRPTSPTPGLDTPYLLTVRVLDPQGRAVEDAEVWTSLGGNPQQTKDGWAFDLPLAKIPPGANLTVYAARKRDGLFGKTEVKPQGRNVRADVRLSEDRTAAIAGRVVDDTGRPIAGASVGPVEGAQRVSTDDSGKFSFSPSSATTAPSLLLYAEKPGYRPAVYWTMGVGQPATIVLSRGDSTP